ncbi:MAG: NAD(P)H-dependent glycerol-3-phosphate dehydrogenase [Silvanigrellaceae bacterium]
MRMQDSSIKTQSNEPLAAATSRVLVLGPGVFGRALAKCAQEAGSNVTLLGLDEAALADARLAFANCRGVELQTMDRESVEFLRGRSVDLIILAVPCQALRSVASWCRDVLWPVIETTSHVPVLCAAKGVELGTLMLPHEILVELLPENAGLGVLSGPSFAKELQAGLPTAIVVASADDFVRRSAERLLHRPHFRVYGTDDIVGVELGGAIKNVIAVVAGVVDGLQLGHNARAAVVTRGLGEMAQMGAALGAQPMTFLGLSGLGDLILTCTGDLSRNRRFGLTIAQNRGRPMSEVLAEIGETVEGYSTARSAFLLSKKLSLDTPILQMAYEVLHEDRPVDDAVAHLLNREQKGEFDWIGK